MRITCQKHAVPDLRSIEVLIHLEEALALQKGRQSQEYRDAVQELVGLLVHAGKMQEAQRYMDKLGGPM